MRDDVVLLLQEGVQHWVIRNSDQDIEVGQIPLPVLDLVEECLTLGVDVLVAFNHEVFLDRLKKCVEIDLFSIVTVC